MVDPKFAIDPKFTMQNPQNGPPMQASSSAAESDAATEHIATGSMMLHGMESLLQSQTRHATEHIAPASLGSTCEASQGSGDLTIKSLADVVSKLASEVR